MPVIKKDLRTAYKSLPPFLKKEEPKDHIHFHWESAENSVWELIKRMRRAREETIDIPHEVIETVLKK